MGPPVKRQATLHQLGKVQTSRSSSYYNVSLEDIARHKKTLEDKATTKSDFVASLRQLSSMLLTKDLLEQSMIGLCVNRVAKKHPDGDMRVLARNIVEKWREEVRGQVKRDAKRLRTVAGWRKPNRTTPARPRRHARYAMARRAMRRAVRWIRQHALLCTYRTHVKLHS